MQRDFIKAYSGVKLRYDYTHASSSAVQLFSLDFISF